MDSSAIVSTVISRQQVISDILTSEATKDFYFTYEPDEWLSPKQQQGPCRLLILDSSFNPPTKAHVDLLHKSIQAYPDNYFHGSLLLFSTNNVDKKLTGASVLQRSQMMEIVALEQVQQQQQRQKSILPTAVALTPYGRFIDKAIAIKNWYSSNRQNPSELKLYFILGYDTMVRLLDPKYYQPTPVKEALAPFFQMCHIICADRGLVNTSFWEKVNEEYGQDLIKRIRVDPSYSPLSSTLARNILSTGDNNSSINDILDQSIIEFLDQCEDKIYHS